MTLRYQMILLLISATLTNVSLEGGLIHSLRPDQTPELHLHCQSLINERTAQDKALDTLEHDNPIATPIATRCIQHNFLDFLKILLEHILDLKTCVAYGWHHTGLLSVAAFQNNVDACKLLISFGAPVNSNPILSDSPPLHAITHPGVKSNAHQKPNILKLFLKHGANPNIQHLGETPLLSMIHHYEDYRAQAVKMARLFITGGTHITDEVYDALHEKIHRKKDNPEKQHAQALLESITKTVHRHHTLFSKVANGKKIKLKNIAISRRHARDIEGNNILFHALMNINKKNRTFARKIAYLWPELIVLPNFKGKSIIDDPELRNRAILLLLGAAPSSSRGQHLRLQAK